MKINRGPRRAPHNISLRPLQDCEEFADLLREIVEDDSSTAAIFGLGSLHLPADLADKLRPLIGRRIAILRLGQKHYVRSLRLS